MIQIIFLLLLPALLCTTARLLWLFLPGLHTRAGRRLFIIVPLLLAVPLLIPALKTEFPVYSFAVLLTGAAALAAMLDNRPSSTAYELYPVAVGLIAPLVIITDFLSETPALHHSFSSPVIGLLIGLGIAALASLLEVGLSRQEPLALATAEMCAAAGFFAGYPGILWVLGGSAFIYFGWLLLQRRIPRLGAPRCNGIIACCLVLYLCGHALFAL